MILGNSLYLSGPQRPHQEKGIMFMANPLGWIKWNIAYKVLGRVLQPTGAHLSLFCSIFSHSWRWPQDQGGAWEHSNVLLSPRGQMQLGASGGPCCPTSATEERGTAPGWCKGPRTKTGLGARPTTHQLVTFAKNVLKTSFREYFQWIWIWFSS